MTTPPPSAPRPPSAGHPGLDRFFDSVRSIGIVRTQDRWIGGVAGGLARRLGIDPLLMRGLVVVATIFFGLGLLLYGIAWLLLPEEADGRIHLEQAIRGDVSAGMVGASIFTAIGLIRPGSWFGSGLFKVLGGIVNGLAVAALIVVIVVLIARSSGKRKPGFDSTSTAWRSPSTGAARGSATGPASPLNAPSPHATSPLGEPMSGPDSAPSPTDPAGSPIPTAYPAASASHATPDYGTPTPSFPATPTNPAPPVARASAVATQPRAKGPGAPMIATVTGLALFVIAGAVFASRYLNWVVPDVAAAAIGTILVLIGLGLVVTGLRGRRSGTLGFFAIVALFVLAPIAAGSIGAFHDALPITWNNWNASVGSKSWAPTKIADAESGFESTAGNVRVDLRQLEREPVSFKISSGAGNLDLILPEDARVEVDASGGAGETSVTVPTSWSVTGSAGLGSSSSGSTGQLRTFEVSGLGQDLNVSSGASPLWHITLQAGAGNTTITTQKG